MFWHDGSQSVCSGMMDLSLWCTMCPQTSGEAQYTTDVPTQPRECAAAFVVSTQVRERRVGKEGEGRRRVEGVREREKGGERGEVMVEGIEET